MTAFHELCGNEHAKRAAEVALTGGHRIVFVGPWESQAQDFACLVCWTAMDIRGDWDNTVPLAVSWSPCACGYCGDMAHECTCSIEAIAAYRLENPLPTADIYVEVVQPRAQRVIQWAKNHFIDGEWHEQVVDRIKRAMDTETPVDIVDTAWALLEAAAGSLQMQPATLRNTIAVAQTIARMARASRVETTVAEGPARPVVQVRTSARTASASVPTLIQTASPTATMNVPWTRKKQSLGSAGAVWLTRETRTATGSSTASIPSMSGSSTPVWAWARCASARQWTNPTP